MSNDTPFKGSRVTRTAALTLPSPPEQVFPLFGPIREAEWAEGWEPKMIYSESPLGEETGAVFTTQHPGEPDTIWMITQYDPTNYAIKYARVTPGLRIAQVTIMCERERDGATRAAVTYQFTALSEAGNSFIEGFSEDHYQHMITSWQAAISHTLMTGERMSHYP